MFAIVSWAVSSLGDRVSRFLNHKPDQIAEFRSFLDHQQNAIDDSGPHNEQSSVQFHWVDRNALKDLVNEYSVFSRAMRRIAELATAPDHHHRLEVNQILIPLAHILFANRIFLDPSGEDDLGPLFSRQVQKSLHVLDRVYEISIIVKIRDSHETVPASLEYNLTGSEIEQMKAIKDLFSAPNLPVICDRILQIFHQAHGSVSVQFMDNVAVDLEAVTRNIPPPSYVLSQEFRQKLQQVFPPPIRKDLTPQSSLPGAFPDSAESDVFAQERTSSSESDIFSRSTIPDTASSSTRWSPSSQSNSAGYIYEDATSRVSSRIYGADADARLPVSFSDLGTMRSILKNKRRQSLKQTPKRPGTGKAPRSVRFTEPTRSPKQRTYGGLELSRVAKVAELDIRPFDEDAHPSLLGTMQNIDPNSKNNLTRLISTYSKQEDQENRDPSTRIEELLAIPSLDSLTISDDARANNEFRKKQAALKAAEEARKAAEAARRVAEEKEQRAREERLARSGGLREPRQALVSPIAVAWRTRALDTLRAPATAILAKTGEGTDLRRHDFAKVVPPTEWLNDEIVNGSLNWLDQAINSAAGIKDVKQTTRKCLAMSSYFFKRLQDQGVGRTQRTLRRFGVTKDNLLSVDTVLMPICEHSHWTLIVVRPAKRTISHMDSLNPRGSAAYTNLALAWIKDVLEDKFQAPDWSVQRFEAPRQINGYDCGVHTITNAMCVGLGLSPVDSYTAEDMPQQRIRIAAMLLNGGFQEDFDLRIY